MGTIIISSDIISAVFLAVLLCGSIFGAKDKNKETLYFTGCLGAAVIGTIADSVTYLTLEPGRLDALLTGANMISYVMTAVMFLLFTLYFLSVIKTKASVPKWAIYPVIVISAIDAILVIIGTANRKMIYMDNGEVMDGEWTDYPSMLLFLGILYLYFVLFSYRKAMSSRQLLAFGGFLFFPIADSWITLFDATIDFTYPLVALAFVVIYVIIREQTVAEDSMRKILFEEDALTDPKTGFKNKKAYDEAVKNKERGRAKGVLYCSLNHLDEIREKDGPEAVDKYVLKFDEILRDSFSGADICRVSENNFAVFMYNAGEDVLEKRVQKFSSAMEENDDMAKFGYVYSDTVPLFDMVRDAQAGV